MIDHQRDFIEAMDFFQNIIDNLQIDFIQDDYNEIIKETDTNLSMVGNITIEEIAINFIMKTKQLLLSNKVKERINNYEKFYDRLNTFLEMFEESSDEEDVE